MAISSSNAQSNKSNPLSSNKKETNRPSSSKHLESPAIEMAGSQTSGTDSGKSCHQCRQKTQDLLASCKNIQRKPCSIKFCHKCLLNRYGERAEVAAILDDWRCPRCRGVCNCSICMKKKGHQPTGMLAQTAKAIGFSSVLDMLQVKGADCLTLEMAEKESHGSPNKLTAVSKAFTPKRKYGKENSSVDPNIQCKPSSANEDLKLGAEIGRKKLNLDNGKDNACNGRSSSNAPKKKLNLPCRPLPVDGEMKLKDIIGRKKLKLDAGNDKSLTANSKDNGVKKKLNVQHKPLLAGGEVKLKANIGKKKLKLDDGNACSVGGNDHDAKEDDVQRKAFEKIHGGTIKEEENIDRCNGMLPAGNEMKLQNGESVDDAEVEHLPVPSISKRKKCVMGSCNKDVDTNIVLPRGHDLVTVGGVELSSANDVGPALQFLEFCAAFRQALDLRKGQAEAVLRELTRGRVGRHGGLYSSIVQLHIKLLSFMQKDHGEESPLESISNGNLWLQALGKCVSESQYGLKQFPLDYFRKGADGYNRLDSSEKLRILNCLCDEILGTEQLRKWIDGENIKYAGGMKEARAKVLAAKEKKKQIKQKFKDEMAAALLSSQNGAPLSIVKHENLISKMQIETDKAHAEMLEAMATAPKNKEKQTLDALRTQPLLLEGNGQIFWRLRGYSNRSEIILQDIGSWDSITSQDKWFAYGDDQQKAVEKYTSTLRKKKHRT